MYGSWQGTHQEQSLSMPESMLSLGMLILAIGMFMVQTAADCRVHISCNACFVEFAGSF